MNRRCGFVVKEIVLIFQSRTGFNLLKLLKVSVFVLSLCLMTPVTAASFTWTTRDVMKIQARGISLKRPNDRWRVVEAEDYGLVDMIYHQHGGNVVIEVKEWPHFQYHKNRAFSKGIAKKSSLLRQKLLEPFEAEGYQFFDFEFRGHGVFAVGTNSSRKIVVLNFYFDQEHDLNNPVVIQMVVPREQYNLFREDFFSVVDSITQN